MRTILFALLLATQVAFSQQKPAVVPCELQDIPWNSSIKTLNEFARKTDIVFYDMEEDTKNNMMQVTYRGLEYSRVYTFTNGQYVGSATLYFEPSKTKLDNMVREQIERYISHCDSIIGADSFAYKCNEDAIKIKVKATEGAYMIVTTNVTAIERAKSKKS